MTSWKALAFSFVAAAALLITPAAVAPAHAQVAVGINLGPAPICPYGYFDYAPYDCAPYGYYGPDWFVGGLFLGAGPWFHVAPLHSPTSRVMRLAMVGAILALQGMSQRTNIAPDSLAVVVLAVAVAILGKG